MSSQEKVKEYYHTIIQYVQALMAVVATLGVGYIGVSYFTGDRPVIFADAHDIAMELQEQRSVLAEQNRLLEEQTAELALQRELAELFKANESEIRQRDDLIEKLQTALDEQIATVQAQIQMLERQQDNVEDLKEWRTLQNALLVLQGEVYALQTDSGATAAEGSGLSRLISFGTTAPSGTKGLTSVPGKPIPSSSGAGAATPAKPGSTTPDLTVGPQPYTPSQSSGNSTQDAQVSAGSVDQREPDKQRNTKTPGGNLITCVPPNPPNYAWIWLYRLDDNNEWQRISRGIGSINADGYLKLDGLPVDVTRFGNRGEPYLIEQVIDGVVTQRVGDFQNGGSEFRIYPEQDNFTPWQCR